MRINTNVAALNAWRNLTVNDSNMAKSLERLSSGFRINRAADDAAGLAISEKMKGQIGGLRMAERNAQDGISMIQTAEGALTESSSILLRMRDLANQATNGTMESEHRNKITEEFSQLKEELTRIADTTSFNGINLLKGGLGSEIDEIGTDLTVANGISNIETIGAAAGNYTVTLEDGNLTVSEVDGEGEVVASQTLAVGTLPSGHDTIQHTFSKLGIRITINAGLTDDIDENNEFAVVAGNAGRLQIGADGGTYVEIGIGNMDSAGLGVAGATLTDAVTAKEALESIETAVGTVNDQRAKLGALQNRLEHTIANLGNSIENLTSAESRIRDVDMALEMANFTKGQILLQAGTAMLAQANSRPQSVLQLLRG